MAKVDKKRGVKLDFKLINRILREYARARSEETMNWTDEAPEFFDDYVDLDIDFNDADDA